MRTSLRLPIPLLVASLLLAATLSACATPSSASGASDPDEGEGAAIDTTRRRGFMGLDDGPLEADWESWTPINTLAASDIDPILVFDVWHLTDEDERERLWVSFFSLIGFSRTYLPAEASPTVRALLTLLDPSESAEVKTDYVFFVGQTRQSEGVLVRTYRTMPGGGTVGVVLELSRDTGEGDNPTRIRLHLHSGHEEAPSLAVDLARPAAVAFRNVEDERWVTVGDEGVASELAVVRDIVASTFWKPAIGPGYVEPPFEVTRTSVGDESTDFPRGHGVEPDLRPIDRVWIDSVFPPRIDLPAPKPAERPPMARPI